MKSVLTIRAIMACAAIFLAPSIAFAQAPEVQALRADQAAIAMHTFAKCAATQRGPASMVLATLPQTVEEEAAVRRLIDPLPDCDIGGTQIAFAQRYMRGGVAESLLLRDFAELRGPARRATAPVFALPSSDDVASLSDATKGSIGMIMFGQCVAKSDLSAVSTLLSTRFGSRKERAAYATLDGAMRGCAPDPAILNIGRLQMRVYLAEGAYRNAAAEQAGSN